MMNTQGVTNVSLTDAPGDYDNVWVTVGAVWFHTSNTAGPDDSGWVKFPLTTPVTVDLLTLQNGNLSQMFDNMQPPNGTYRQIRVFLVGPDAPLTASAAAAKLIYNNQVNYQDANDTEQNSPLELVNPSKGIALYGTFTVANGSTLDLALDFNVNRDVLPFFVGNQQDYVLKPRLAYFDLSHVGAITGSVNCANLLAAGGNGFAYNLVIKAEMPSSTGNYDVVDRETGIKVDISGNSCTFTLFPVDVPQGSSTTNYDVLIRGRNMETMIVQGVPVNVGTTPTSGATQLNTTPLNLTMGSEYTANMPANMPVIPTGADVKFYQTLTGGPTYEVRFRGVNPFTGIFTDDEPLSVGNLQVGSYAGGNPTLSAVMPMGGAGAFMPYGDAPYFTRTEALTGTSDDSDQRRRQLHDRLAEHRESRELRQHQRHDHREHGREVRLGLPDRQPRWLHRDHAAAGPGARCEWNRWAILDPEYSGWFERPKFLTRALLSARLCLEQRAPVPDAQADRKHGGSGSSHRQRH